jgi:hypothetical protein
MDGKVDALVERLLGEGPIGFAEVAERLGRLEGRGPVAPATIARWAARGVKVPDGRRVKLEVVRVAGRYATSWPAVVRFLAAQQPADAAPAPRSPAQQRRSSERAADELAKSGI